MIDHEVVAEMARELNILFWDFRCNFMHHPSSIPFDFQFFKLVKNSQIVFGDKEYSGGSIITFKDRALNSFLSSKTVEEGAFKNLILKFFFLRKEFMKIKRGEPPLEDFRFYLSLLVEVGGSYGYIESIEAVKRHVEYTQSDDQHVRMVGGPFSRSIGGLIDNTLSLARKFRPSKKTPRHDALGRLLEEIVKNFIVENSRLPEYTEVIKCLKKHALSGHEIISKVSKSQISWCREKGKIPEQTSVGALQERLTKIRKKISVKR